jgi:class 3 adenylate cyclase/tetratricopeptide (TPR) repeat protein
VITCARCGRENAIDARFCSYCGNALLASPSPGAGEVRKTVTVMFMDAVGSTGLGERTDPESLRRVMTRYFDEIRTIVEKHGGTVEKYIGDAVMAVFGVPTVHEDDALRAVRAALEIRGRLESVSHELQEQRGASIAWRTGINTGEVVAGDAGAGQGFVSGDAVNVAARLEQAAVAGEILIGSETLRLVRDAVVVKPSEPIAAKGKTEPLAASRLIELTRQPTGGSAHRLDAPMVGRQRQRRQLNEAYEQVVDERIGYLFTILGSAGVGKSRLVAEFLGGLGDGAVILHGRCLSYGEGITYWPIAEAVRQAADLEEDDDDDALRQKLGGLVADDRDRVAVVERMGQLLGRFTGTGSREETFWAVRTLFEALAATKPVVLVLDDIHWAEPTLLELIEHLADWIREAPVLLLCVARQELLEIRPDWGGGKSYSSTITLDALNDNESRELMVNLLGQVEVSADLVDKIGAAAEGNPLFVEEMVGMLIDRGYLERRGSTWVAVTDLAEVAVPPTIQALLAARLDGLPLPERAVIDRGSVEGKIFHRRAIAELAPPEMREGIPGHLRSLSRKELVRPDRSDFVDDEAFRFRHLLIRDAAYSAVPKEARAEMHARFAEWLARTSGDHVGEYEEILGYHYEQAWRYRAELGSLDEETRRWGAEAARHLGASGMRAMHRGDANAGLKLLRSAYELAPDDPPERGRLAGEYGWALNVNGDLRGSDDLLRGELEAAQSRGDELSAAQIEVAWLGTQTTLGVLTIQHISDRSAELLKVFEKYGDDWGIIRATFEYARHEFFAGRAGVTYSMLSGLMESYPADQLPMLVLGMSLGSMYWGPTPVSKALAHLATIDVLGSRTTEAFVLRYTGGLIGLQGDFDAARQALARAQQIERELGRTVLEDSIAGHFMGPLETEAGNYEEAEKAMLGAYERMSGRGDMGFSSTVAGNLGGLYVKIERWDDAERFGRLALDTAQPDDVEAQSQGNTVLGRVHAAHGDVAEGERYARLAVEIAEKTDYLDRRGQVLLDLAKVLEAAGRLDEARQAVEDAIERFEAKEATFTLAKARRRLAEISAQDSRG